MAHVTEIVDPRRRSLEACLSAVHTRISPRFARAEPRRRTLAYLRGLLGPIRRKNGWQLAAQAGESTPDGMQRLLASAQWDADWVRDDLREFVVDNFGDRDGVLVIGEREFVKKGSRSVGVERQFARATGHVENCQVGLFLVYTSPHGAAIADRELYLPRSWTEDPPRRRRAGIPDEVVFQTRGELAWSMVERALDARMPVRWLAVEEPYGGDRRLRLRLDRRQLPYVLGVGPDEVVPVVHDGQVRGILAGSAIAMIPDDLWLRVTGEEDRVRAGGVSCWARLPMPAPRAAPGTTRWLLLRRSLVGRRGLRFYVCRAEPAVTLRELVGVAGALRQSRECLASACEDAGLATYEVRRWTGWYRHVTLAALAHACLAATKPALRQPGRGMPAPPKTVSRLPTAAWRAEGRRTG